MGFLVYQEAKLDGFLRVEKNDLDGFFGVENIYNKLLLKARVVCVVTNGTI